MSGIVNLSVINLLKNSVEFTLQVIFKNLVLCRHATMPNTYCQLCLKRFLRISLNSNDLFVD